MRWGFLLDSALAFYCYWCTSRQNTFFLKCANRLGRKGHRYFLAINHEGFLLKVWLKDALSATQREAHIVAELLAFSG